mgnify:CR=1 FL=1
MRIDYIIKRDNSPENNYQDVEDRYITDPDDPAYKILTNILKRLGEKTISPKQFSDHPYQKN